MSEYFINNRQLIKNLKINTGTTSSPTWSSLCCASEITLETDMNQDDFYIFCDAVQRHIVSGISGSISTTVKVDAQSTAVISLLNYVTGALSSGDVDYFNTQIKFDLLAGVETNTLSYNTYQCDAIMNIESLGGGAEATAEIGITFNINGTITQSTSA